MLIKQVPKKLPINFALIKLGKKSIDFVAAFATVSKFYLKNIQWVSYYFKNKAPFNDFQLQS